MRLLFDYCLSGVLQLKLLHVHSLFFYLKSCRLMEWVGW